MRGARDALTDGFAHVENQITAIENAVHENPGYAFDLVKTLIESVCRTILTERSVAYSRRDDLPKLYKTVTQNIPFLPPEASQATDARKSLLQTLNGLHTSIQGICELRNQCGFSSHGSAGPRSMLESIQARMAAEAADTIVGFLSRIHRQNRAWTSPNGISYDENPEFNDSIDETHGNGPHYRCRISS